MSFSSPWDPKPHAGNATSSLSTQMPDTQSQLCPFRHTSVCCISSFLFPGWTGRYHDIPTVTGFNPLQICFQSPSRQQSGLILLSASPMEGSRSFKRAWAPTLPSLTWRSMKALHGLAPAQPANTDPLFQPRCTFPAPSSFTPACLCALLPLLFAAKVASLPHLASSLHFTCALSLTTFSFESC